MPIYEYECQACHHRVELIQKVTDAPLAHCPKCHGVVKKLIAPPALQCKGSGWYITDYAAKGKGKAEDSSTEKKDSDSKPAATPTASSAVEKKSEGGGGGSSAPSSKSEGSAAS